MKLPAELVERIARVFDSWGERWREWNREQDQEIANIVHNGRMDDALAQIKVSEFGVSIPYAAVQDDFGFWDSICRARRREMRLALDHEAIDALHGKGLHITEKIEGCPRCYPPPPLPEEAEDDVCPECGRSSWDDD